MGRFNDAIDKCMAALGDERTTPKQARMLLSAIRAAGDDEGGGDRRSPGDEKKIRELEGRVAELEKRDTKDDGAGEGKRPTLDEVAAKLKEAIADPETTPAERKQLQAALRQLEGDREEEARAMAHVSGHMKMQTEFQTGTRSRGNSLELGVLTEPRR